MNAFILSGGGNLGSIRMGMMAVSVPCPPPDRRSCGGIMRHSLTMPLFPRIRLDALDLPGGDGDERTHVASVPEMEVEAELEDGARTEKRTAEPAGREG